MTVIVWQTENYNFSKTYNKDNIQNRNEIKSKKLNIVNL